MNFYKLILIQFAHHLDATNTNTQIQKKKHGTWITQFHISEWIEISKMV
jgi:hypothetical protein